MKFCYIKDLDILWFISMVERSRHLPHAVAYDDTYVWLLDNDECLAQHGLVKQGSHYTSSWELPSPWRKKVKFDG